MSDPKPGTDRTNPKDLVGQSKVDLSLFPPAAHIHGAHAFMDGAVKYGAYNWRERQVRARVYISAAQRHLADFLDGEDLAQDSGVHHLGHVIACCAIILDALETGNLIDDRPVTGAASAILDRINAGILARRDAGTVVASTPVVVTAGADVQVDKIAQIVEAHFSRIVSCGPEPEVADAYGRFPDGSRLRRENEAPTADACRRAAARAAEQLAWLTPAPSRVGAHEPDCACAPGVRCHETFKPSCPRLVGGDGVPARDPNLLPCPCSGNPDCVCDSMLPVCVERRNTGMPGCQEAGTKATATLHSGRIGYGE